LEFVRPLLGLVFIGPGVSELRIESQQLLAHILRSQALLILLLPHPTDTKFALPQLKVSSLDAQHEQESDMIERR
jgi:hypothetical protein